MERERESEYICREFEDLMFSQKQHCYTGDEIKLDTI